MRWVRGADVSQALAFGKSGARAVALGGRRTELDYDRLGWGVSRARHGGGAPWRVRAEGRASEGR